MGWAPWDIPCKGSIPICITDAEIVMAPTARSPPYLRREELKHTLIMLSVLCIINVLIPRARHENSKDGTIFSLVIFSLNMDLSLEM